MKVDFVTVDVFTDRPFGGNPLDVVPDKGDHKGRPYLPGPGMPP